MSEILLRIHSLVPYLFLLLMVLVLVMSFRSLGTGRVTLKQISLARVTMILAHIQFLFGLALLFLGDSAKGAMSLGMGQIMSTAELRLRFVEHPMMMLLGIALITIGFSRAKRSSNDKAKNRNILLFYGIGFLIILSRIPYATWFNL